MKKTLKILALILALCSLLCACKGKSNGKKDKDSADDSSVYELKELDPDEVISQLEVKEYTMDASHSRKDLYLVIENKSDFNIDLHIKLTTYDENGEVVQVLSREISSFEKKTKAVENISNCEDFDTLKYEFTVEQTLEPVVTSDLEYEIIEGKDSIFITVTNKGQINANHVLGYLFLFNNNELVYTEAHSFEGSGLNLPVNVSITNEFRDIPQYTDYEFVLFGEKSSF